mgnify:CR=1 FL=1
MIEDLQTIWLGGEPLELMREPARVGCQLAELRARSPVREGGVASKLSAEADGEPESAYLLAGLSARAAGADRRPDPVALGWLVVAAGQEHREAGRLLALAHLHAIRCARAENPNAPLSESQVELYHAAAVCVRGTPLERDISRACATALGVPPAPADIDQVLYGVASGVDELALFLPEEAAGALRRDTAAALGGDRADGNGSAETTRADIGRPAGPGADQRPRMTVLSEIGDAGSGEGRRLARAYADLCKPLPLAGTALAADTLADLLAARFPWMREAVDAVRGELRLQALAGRPWLHFRPLLLEGPPGCGKTAFASTLARLSGVALRTLDAGGASDDRLLAGTARGWASAHPALPLLAVKTARIANPLILIDELDKCRASHNGDICGTLLGMLEPDTARNWFDPCLIAECDLSQVSWMAAVNDGDQLPGPLRNRLRRVRIGRPTGRHAETALSGLAASLRAELDLPPGDELPLAPGAWRLLTRRLARSGDLRGARAALRAAVAHANGNRQLQ